MPAQYDANGNLIDDGTQQYVYDDLDRLVSMTQGITTTTFGYTGDGDRLWQEVADARTTFALDLNTTLPQVLAQQGPDQSTRYLPGIGQQVGAAWQYLHTDALGSIRHITGEDGSVAGSWRYSPFGEIEATNGAGSLFGYTGEPQDPASGLTYLRARYYHPALGRFLTPDAIVPDVLNGQAWNAYAYVYNDPINLVDPSGYAPWDGAVGKLRGLIGDVAGRVRKGVGAVRDWANQEPCDCEQDGHEFINELIGTYGGPLGVTLTTASAVTRVTERYEARYINWYFDSQNRPITARVLWSDWQERGSRTRELSSFTRRNPQVGETRTVLRTLSDEPVGRWRVTDVSTNWSWGMRGVTGSTLFGGLLSGLGRFIQDLVDNPCLTPAERAMRVLKDAGYGLGIGLAAALIGGAAMTLLGAPPLAATALGYIAGVVGGKMVGGFREQGYLP